MNGLTPLFAQPWAERLGWTLVHFIWQGAMIALLLVALRAMLEDARARHAAACLALATMMAAPAVTFAWLGTGGPAWNPQTAAATTLAPPGASASLHSAAPGLLTWLVMAWLAGVIVCSARLAGGWLSATRLRFSGGRPAPREWQETLGRLLPRMGVRRRVRLLVSARVDVPAVLGWLRPVVLTPVGALTGLPAEHVEALLAHELAHIRRNDYLVNLLQGIVEAVLFYHPAVWWVSKQIRTERELCCDDLAVAASGDVLTYAQALAGLEACRASRVHAAMAANGGSLLKRIARLLEPSTPAAHTMPGPAAAWTLSVLLVLGVCTLIVRGAPQPDYPAVKRETIWVDTVKQGDVPILVRGLGTLTSPTDVEVKIAEVQSKDLQVGQGCSVGFQRSKYVSTGRVTQIRPGVQNGVVTVDLKVAEVPSNVARPAAAVDATIQIGGLINVVYVGRPVDGRANQEAFLFRLEPDGQQAVRTRVQFGRSSVNQIEVRSGLQPGDKVIVSDMSAYKDSARVNLR